MKKKIFAILGIVLMAISALPAHAGAPRDAVEENVNKVLSILRDPKLKGEAAKETKKARLRALYDVMFDEVELSRRTLARNWNRFSPSERREFVLLFKQVLEKAYIDKILAYTNERVIFDREISRGENLAEVHSRVFSSGKEIPISYRAIMKNNTWKVYDVVVENVSLVQNYRTQFNEILAKSTPEELLVTLRKKVKGP
ncbi:MAG: ABC transporter substrate-binding protein [Pseudomonadota bacterium]|nr:ABC transporter substrate-binding protein [Pseudomonadota bacterium]